MSFLQQMGMSGAILFLLSALAMNEVCAEEAGFHNETEVGVVILGGMSESESTVTLTKNDWHHPIRIIIWRVYSAISPNAGPTQQSGKPHLNICLILPNQKLFE